MQKAVGLQVVIALLVAVIAAIIGGHGAGWSAFIGAFACVVPNGLFAMRLIAQTRRPGGASVASFFVGEFIKLALTVAAIFLAAVYYSELNWLAMVCGLVASLYGYLFGFFFDRHS